MTALSADHLSRSYGSTTVLVDVSLALQPGEKVGLVGNNGSGKSTLGRILAGLDEADTGVVARRRELEFAYLSQEPVLDPELTAYEEVEKGIARWREATRRYEALADQLITGRGDQDALIHEQTELAVTIEGLGGWDLRHRIRSVLMHLGIARPEQPVRELSGGERRRVALARVLIAAPGVAILDEPTNHLDADTAEWLERYLRDEFPGALLLITHDRYFLDRVVTRIVELDRGVLYSYPGNYSTYLGTKAERLEQEARTETRRLNVLRREREWLARGPKARSTKQKARINRAGDLEDVVDKAHRRDELPTLQAAGTRTGKRILELRGVGKRFGERVLFEGVDLILTRGERVGIIGRNGAGKTTLVKMILGEEAPSTGEVVLGLNTKVSYFDQGRAELQDDKSIYDNLYEGSDKVRLGERWIDLRAYLENFLFDVPKQRQLVGSLSGGERARVALAKTLRGESNLLILDEPTNDLDLTTLGALEELLVDWPGCALVVTHDRYFLNRVATSILAFELPDDGAAGRAVASGPARVLHYPGDYDTYRSLREERVRALRQADDKGGLDTADTRRGSRAITARTRAQGKDGKTARGLSLAETRELEQLPGDIDALEQTLRDLERRLGDPLFYADRAGEVAATVTAADDSRRRLEGLMALWEELERRRGES